MEIKHQRFLVVESGVRAGSVALFDDGREIGRHSGRGEVSRSEDLLSNIADLLRDANFKPGSLDRIIVSSGPGSFTGLRIGIATALGLCDALRIPLEAVSLLDAMLSTIDLKVDCIAAVPISRNDVACQIRRKDGMLQTPSEPKSVPVGEFIRTLENAPEMTVAVHSGLLPLWGNREPLKNVVNDLGTGMASTIGRAFVLHKIRTVLPNPLYLSATSRLTPSAR